MPTRQRIVAAMWGDILVDKAYLGNITVMHRAAIYDDFTGREGVLFADGQWYDHGPSTDYFPVIEAGKCRMDIPDGLTVPTERISYARHAGSISRSEDSYIECRVFNKGDSITNSESDQRYQTCLYAKVNDTFTDGVGLRMAASHLTITVRRDGAEAPVASFGTFTANDVLRMEFVGSLYTVRVNGALRGQWQDTQKRVAIGADHRSLGLRVHGAHEESGAGPRRFSPTLDYVEYG